MTPEERLGEIVTALESVGVPCLVMGGHSVRFYGLARNTKDFDLNVSPDSWDDLVERLTRTQLFAGRRRGRRGGRTPSAGSASGNSRSNSGARTTSSPPTRNCSPAPSGVGDALAAATNPITQAYLIPSSPATVPARRVFPIEPVVLDQLRRLEAGSALHLSRAEVVRRRYVLFRKEIDRRDKEAIRATINAGDA